MTDEHILFRVEDSIAYLTLNRPTKHNAITAAMGGEIARLSRQSQGTSIAQGLAWENDGHTLCMMTDDAREGMTAFGEKREPVFKGR